MPPELDDSTAAAGGSDDPRRAVFSARRWFAVAIAGLVAAAAVYRLARIGETPGGLYPDEAAEGWDAWRILHQPGFHPLFFDDDGGREALYGYLTAGVFSVAGASVAVLRATSAVLGVLGVLATPLLMRRFGRTASLAATAWAAGSVWLVAVDRDGMRNVLVPLVGTLALAALLGWFDRPGRGRALVAGAACGLGLWTYQPLKLLPLLVAVWLLWLRRRGDPAWPALRRDLRPAIAAYAAVALPIAVVAVSDPANYFGRGLAVSAGNPDYSLSSLPLHTLRTLGMFGVDGDPNPRHDAASMALLPPAVALLFAIGLVSAWRRRADGGRALLLCGVPVFLLPPLIALEGGAPHGLRALGVAPFCAALIGLGVDALMATARVLSRALVITAAVACAAVLLITAGVGAHAYFTRGDADLYDAYAYALVSLAHAAGPGDVVLIDPYRALTVEFIDRDALPRIIDPVSALHLAAGTAVLARDRTALATVLGEPAAARAQVLARDPAGSPVVWRVVV